jgi:alkylhydroperoxidase/carboxymuconolactone decarboxylase family protein YurZ
MAQFKTKPPKPYREFQRRFPKVGRAYENLGAACHDAGPLDAKTRELVKLGIALGANLESGTKAHVRLAAEAGASPEELRHAAVLATTTLGFPAMMRALTWVNEALAKLRQR